MTEELYKIEQIGGVKSAMPEVQQFCQIFFLMLQDKLLRCIIHPLHQLLRLVDDGGTVAPGEDGCEESGYLDVLPSGESPGNADRIIGDEGWTIVFVHLSVQECANIWWRCRHSL